MTSETERADPTYPQATPGGGADATQVEDGALVRAVAEGSHDALAVLYDRYVDSIFAVARRTMSDRGAAEEVVQETFLALWDRAETFDPAMGSVGGWLRAIARNRTWTGSEPPLDGRRWCPIRSLSARGEPDAGSLDRIATPDLIKGGSAAAPRPRRGWRRPRPRRAIQAALRRCPPDEREVIVLAYSDELTQSEIASGSGGRWAR